MKPIGTVNDAALGEVARAVSVQFGGSARMLDPWPDPAHAFDPKRRQYSSVALMIDLKNVRERGATRILGIAAVDIFIPMLTFVFGQAQVSGPLALVSLARLRQEFHGMAPDEFLFHQRLRIEACHELGHTFGLLHCPDKTCIMSLATTMEQLDRKEDRFCTDCRHMLKRVAPSVKEEV